MNLCGCTIALQSAPVHCGVIASVRLFPGAASCIAATLNAWPIFALHQFSTHVCSYVCDETETGWQIKC